MALAQVPDVHLEAVEETQNEGYQSKKAGRPGRQALPMWEFQTGLPAYCRKSGIEMFRYKPKTRGSWIL